MNVLNAEALDRCLQTFLDEAPETPGVLARVEAREGREWTGVAGTADRARLEPLLPDVTFRLASNTKTFTAAAILRLAEEGRLRLDDHSRGSFRLDLSAA